MEVVNITVVLHNCLRSTEAHGKGASETLDKDGRAQLIDGGPDHGLENVSGSQLAGNRPK